MTHNREALLLTARKAFDAIINAEKKQSALKKSDNNLHYSKKAYEYMKSIKKLRQKLFALAEEYKPAQINFLAYKLITNTPENINFHEIYDRLDKITNDLNEPRPY